MNSEKKIKIITEILDRYDDHLCFYCGNMLNGDLEDKDWDEGFSDDWCPECCKNIDPNDNWEDACLEAIDKIIHNEPFKP